MHLWQDRILAGVITILQSVSSVSLLWLAWRRNISLGDPVAATAAPSGGLVRRAYLGWGRSIPEGTAEERS